LMPPLASPKINADAIARAQPITGISEITSAKSAFRTTFHIHWFSDSTAYS
jgi:hypothetical protein